MPPTKSIIKTSLEKQRMTNKENHTSYNQGYLPKHQDTSKK